MNRRAMAPRLVGDVGGTQARFAWASAPGEELGPVATYACREFPDLEALLARVLAERGEPGGGASVALAVAMPVGGDRLAMTNLDWRFSVDAVRHRFAFERLVVLNDFSALALSLPTLGPDERRAIGGGAPVEGAPAALLGPGTGLGVSGLFVHGDAVLPLAGEGGHASLAGGDDEEDRVVASLRRRFGHASAERALSGAGLVNLHAACCEIAGREPEPLAPSEVTARALAGTDSECRKAVELFFSLLGGVAGNLALTLGAHGGVWIGGGIVPQLGDWIDRSRFRERFEAKGRYRDYLARIPTWLITATDAPALRGALRALDAPPPGARTAGPG